MRIAWLVFVFCACSDHGKGGGMGGDGGTGDAPGSGKTCGGFANAQCPAGEFCDFPTNDCGGADGVGTCRTRPGGCTDQFDPVCGCDGTIHPSPCDANAAGFDLNALGTCSLPAGKFACGFRQCDLSTTFCHRDSHPGGADAFGCMGLPTTCGATPTCSCLAGETCGTSCSGSAASGLTVTCLQGV